MADTSGNGKGEPRRWFRYYADSLSDPAVQKLPADQFKTLFLATIKGETTPFSRWLKGDNGRVFSAEWRAMRARIFARDDYTCGYCGSRGGKLECDHVVPVSRGGPSVESNLVTACKPCNRSKRDKLVSEWKEAVA